MLLKESRVPTKKIFVLGNSVFARNDSVDLMREFTCDVDTDGVAIIGTKLILQQKQQQKLKNNRFL